MGELCLVGDRQSHTHTDTDTHKHTHINTMTQPSLGARPSEKRFTENITVAVGVETIQ